MGLIRFLSYSSGRVKFCSCLFSAVFDVPSRKSPLYLTDKQIILIKIMGQSAFFICVFTFFKLIPFLNSISKISEKSIEE